MQAIEFEAKIDNGTIRLPDECRQWEKKSVRVIVLEKESTTMTRKTRRSPHPAIAGKGKVTGDLIAPVVDESDWECLK
jgi:hypothetical protein